MGMLVGSTFRSFDRVRVFRRVGLCLLRRRASFECLGACKRLGVRRGQGVRQCPDALQDPQHQAALERSGERTLDEALAADHGREEVGEFGDAGTCDGGRVSVEGMRCRRLAARYPVEGVGVGAGSFASCRHRGFASSPAPPSLVSSSVFSQQGAP